jgi:hypothetical protein
LSWLDRRILLRIDRHLVFPETTTLTHQRRGGPKVPSGLGRQSLSHQ